MDKDDLIGMLNIVDHMAMLDSKVTILEKMDHVDLDRSNRTALVPIASN